MTFLVKPALPPRQRFRTSRSVPSKVSLCCAVPHRGEAVALMYLCSLLIYSFTVTGFAHVLVDDPDDVHDQQLKSLYRVVWLGLVICAAISLSLYIYIYM